MPRVAMVRAWRGRGLGCPLLQPADAMTTTALRGLVESTLSSSERQDVPPIGAVLIAQQNQALSGARCGTKVSANQHPTIEWPKRCCPAATAIPRKPRPAKRLSSGAVRPGERRGRHICDEDLALLSPREERPPPLIVCDLPPVPRDGTEGDPAWSPACQA